jgi:hypothetical protein
MNIEISDIEIAALMVLIDDWHGQDEHAKTSEGFRAVKVLQALFERIAKQHPNYE